MGLTKNYILIGMMGSGKSTLGEKLADELGLMYLDLDKMIEESIGMTIREYFSLNGENAFRCLETVAVMNASKLKGVVVSCGGGVVLKEENMLALAENGVIIYLDCDAETILQRLENDRSRPLLKDVSLKKIEDILSCRRPLYEKYAEITIDARQNIQDILKEVLFKL